jgi:hypothetical protein
MENAALYCVRHLPAIITRWTEAEDSSLLRCDAVLLGHWLLTFRRILGDSFSEVKQSILLELRTLKNEAEGKDR